MCICTSVVCGKWLILSLHDGLYRKLMLSVSTDPGYVQDRVRYEADALREQHRLCPEHVPAVYHFDPQNALIVMQYLPPPHVILRKSIVQVTALMQSCILNQLIPKNTHATMLPIADAMYTINAVQCTRMEASFAAGVSLSVLLHPSSPASTLLVFRFCTCCKQVACAAVH